MRMLDTDFATHIAQGETTLRHCWRLIRRDDVMLGFTDHNGVLAFDGTDYAPVNGLDGGDVPARLGAQVQTSEVFGVLTSAAISEDDILLGRYDGAMVEI